MENCPPQGNLFFTSASAMRPLPQGICIGMQDRLAVHQSLPTSVLGPKGTDGAPFSSQIVQIEALHPGNAVIRSHEGLAPCTPLS